MTRQEAIDYLNSLPEDSGVCVMTVQDEDVEQYLSDEFNAAYAKLGRADRNRVLSALASQVHELVEVHPDHGFGNLAMEAAGRQSPEDMLAWLEGRAMEF